jgi:hypothetical protein
VGFVEARLLTANLVSLLLLLSGIEFLFLSRNKKLNAVWSEENLASEFERGLAFGAFARWLSSKNAFRQLAIAELILATAALIVPTAPLFLFLFLIHLLICIRFRGAFNGGSDQMIFILLTGLFFAFVLKNESTAKFGLLYIAIQLLYSYLKAGVAKVRSRDWRSGDALGIFLSRSFYADTRAQSLKLIQHKGTAKVLNFGVVLFELTVWLAPLLKLTTMYFAFAFCFHFVIYRTLGLNRFFWAWIAAWPSVFYLSRMISL